MTFNSQGREVSGSMRLASFKRFLAAQPAAPALPETFQYRGFAITGRRSKWFIIEGGDPRVFKSRSAGYGVVREEREEDGSLVLHLERQETPAEASARRIRDRLFSLWVERAPRFGAVALSFPRSLRCQRFVASFWAPEVFFSCPLNPAATPGSAVCWYACGMLMTRFSLDFACSLAVRNARPVDPVLISGGRWHGYVVDRALPAFWSPELPEVLVGRAHPKLQDRLLGEVDR